MRGNLLAKALKLLIMLFLKIPSNPIGSINSTKHFVSLKGINSGIPILIPAPKLKPKSIGTMLAVLM